jgi:hypothetical protein
MLKKLLAATTALALSLSPAAALAQAYPVNNPAYIPTAVLAATSCSAACTVTLNTNGVGTATFRISGSGTGIAATAQVSNDRSISPTYTNTTSYPVGGAPVATITSAGLYRVNTNGASSVRLNVTAVTGSITITGAATPASFAVIDLPERKSTYSAGITGLSPAASATDLLTITGSATTTVQIDHVECRGISTAAATAVIQAVIRSTADTSGTSTAPTAVPHDSNDAAATAVVAAYTANPTLGTLVGVVRTGALTTTTAASSAVSPPGLVWDFGSPPMQEITLRGAAQQFALNANATSLTSGASLDCSITWTEE